MYDARWRQPAIDEPVHAFPREAMFVAASFQHMKPHLSEASVKCLKRPVVAGHAVVLVVPAQHRTEPVSRLGYRRMKSSAQFQLEDGQLGPQTFGYRLASDTEASPTRARADVSKPKKRKGLRFTVSAPQTIGPGIPAKFNEPGFVRL